MKQSSETFTVALNESGVDSVSERIRAFLTARKFSRREIMRYALSAEEILLGYLARPERPAEVTVNMGTKFFMPFISIELDGRSINIYAPKSDEPSVLKDNLLSTLGLAPSYSYRGEKNLYHFRLKRAQKNPLLTLFIVLACAVGVGLLGLLLPQEVRETVVTGCFDPLHDTFLNILSCLAGPMIFLSVAWGIYGIGDTATLKRIGKRLLLRYAGTVCLCLLVGAAVCIPVFRPAFTGGESAGDLSFIFKMLLDIFPKDIVSPFVTGNTLQIIFMAIIFGIALLFLGQKTQSVVRGIEQINNIIQFIIEFISRLVPYFIFIVLVSMIWSQTIASVSGLQSMVLMYLAVALFTQFLLLLFTGLKNRVNPFLLLKKGLPTLVIALTTASSAAAFGSNLKACREEYGIDESITSFGIPLGMVIFKPNTSISYLVMALFFAKSYGVAISAEWILILLFSAAVLAMATPPIPGGALTAYTVLFTQLGIPAEAIAIALACDAIFDFITTGFDQFSIPFCLINQASSLGLVDRRVLTRRKEKKQKSA